MLCSFNSIWMTFRHRKCPQNLLNVYLAKIGSKKAILYLRGVSEYTSVSQIKILNKSSGATALQGFGRQSGRRRSAKLVPTFADRGTSRGQRNGSPRPLISVYRTWIATYFIQVAPQLTSRGSRG